MKIFLATDHAGFNLKNKLYEYLVKKGYVVEDVGDKVLDPDDDYPQFAHKAVNKLLESGDREDRAILICGSGEGMAIAANRFKGIRASVVFDEMSAKETREDNDSNVLSIPARMLEQDEAIDIVEVWLNTPFSNAPRHKRRIAELDDF